MGVASLVIELLGQFSARVRGAPLPRLRSRRGEWLLALLALRGGEEIDRVWLAGTLWPDAAPDQSLYNLRRNLAGLRRALGPEAGRLRAASRRTLSLDLSGAVVDVLAFDAAIAAQETAALERAVTLYRGPLLEGCEEAWAFQERRVREEAYLQALETLAERALAEGDVVASERYLRRAVATDPLRERAQRALMAALARGGNYAAAIEAYRELRLLLHRELSAPPDRETTALFERIRSEARLRPKGGAAESAQEEAPARRPFPRAAAPGNLPSPLTSFIGREREIAEVRRCLATTRLLTLTGPGGCGKTRLALESAGTLAGRFPDGVWLVELAALTDPVRVPDTVASALGLSPAPSATPVPVGEDRPAYSRLIDALRPQALLLLLDNCEHLAEACARLAESLLRACPELCVLATSREPLGVIGETALRVPSLSCPPVGAPLVGALPHRAGHPQAVPLLQYEAVQLFVDRATVAQPAFCLTEQNASAVAQVCRRLDGISQNRPEESGDRVGGRTGEGTAGGEDRGTPRRPVPTAHGWQPRRPAAPADLAGADRLEL